MEQLLTTLFLGIFFGPGVASPYALKYYTPDITFLILAILYIGPIPIFFKIANSIHYHTIRRRVFLNKLAQFANVGIRHAVDMVDDIVIEFGRRRGEIGYMFGLLILSSLFGVYLAIVLAYILKVDEGKAFFSIGLGVMLGLLFWIYVSFFALSFASADTFVGFGLLIAGLSMVYGRKQELRTIQVVLEKRLEAEGNTFKKALKRETAELKKLGGEVMEGTETIERKVKEEISLTKRKASAKNLFKKKARK